MWVQTLLAQLPLVAGLVVAGLVASACLLGAIVCGSDPR